MNGVALDFSNVWTGFGIMFFFTGLRALVSLTKYLTIGTCLRNCISKPLTLLDLFTLIRDLSFFLDFIKDRSMLSVRNLLFTYSCLLSKTDTSDKVSFAPALKMHLQTFSNLTKRVKVNPSKTRFLYCNYHTKHFYLLSALLILSLNSGNYWKDVEK